MNFVILAAAGIGGSTLLGTAAGFFLGGLNDKMKDAAVAFAAGVMLSAAAFGLFVPAMDMVSGWGCLMIALGAALGALFITGIEWLSGRISKNGMLTRHPELMFVVAIAVHKFPEGMAGGVGLCGMDPGAAGLVALGIAIQNLPEGAVMIPPMISAGVKRRWAAVVALLTGALNAAGVFAGALWGSISGAVLPLALSFAGGAMIYVIIADMIPQAASGRFRFGTAAAMGGFLAMSAVNVLF